MDVMVVNPKLVEEVKKLLEKAEWEAATLSKLLEVMDKDPAEMFYYLKDSAYILFSHRDEEGIGFRVDVAGTKIGEIYVKKDGAVSGKINITRDDVAWIIANKIVDIKNQLTSLQHELKKLRDSTVRGLDIREDD